MMKTLWMTLMLALLAHSAWAGSTEEDCSNLILDYAYYRDLGDADAVANLFTEDAVLTILGTAYEGRDAIHERTASGDGGLVYRHMMSTSRIFPVDRKNATGVSYVTIYAAQADSQPMLLRKPIVVGEYHDKFTRTSRGWKIKERTFVSVFAPKQRSKPNRDKKKD